MPSIFEELGCLCPDQQGPLVLVNELQASRFFILAQPFIPLFEMKSFQLLARLWRHRGPGERPELLVCQSLESFSGFHELGSELTLGGLRLAATPLCRVCRKGEAHGVVGR